MLWSPEANCAKTLPPGILAKMKPTSKFTAKQEVCCSACGQTTPSYDIVNYGSIEQGYKQLCGQCFVASGPTILVFYET